MATERYVCKKNADELKARLNKARCPKCGRAVFAPTLANMDGKGRKTHGLNDDLQVWCTDMGHWVGDLNEAEVIGKNHDNTVRLLDKWSRSGYSIWKYDEETRTLISKYQELESAKEEFLVLTRKG